MQAWYRLSFDDHQMDQIPDLNEFEFDLSPSPLNEKEDDVSDTSKPSQIR